MSSSLLDNRHMLFHPWSVTGGLCFLLILSIMVLCAEVEVSLVSGWETDTVSPNRHESPACYVKGYKNLEPGLCSSREWERRTKEAAQMLIGATFLMFKVLFLKCFGHIWGLCVFRFTSIRPTGLHISSSFVPVQRSNLQHSLKLSRNNNTDRCLRRD